MSRIEDYYFEQRALKRALPERENTPLETLIGEELPMKLLQQPSHVGVTAS